MVAASDITGALDGVFFGVAAQTWPTSERRPHGMKPHAHVRSRAMHLGCSTKRRLAACLVALSFWLIAAPGQAASPLRIAISLSDIPRLWGAPDGGFEGVR